MLHVNRTVRTRIDFLGLQVNGELLPSLVYEIEIRQRKLNKRVSESVWGSSQVRLRGIKTMLVC